MKTEDLVALVNSMFLRGEGDGHVARHRGRPEPHVEKSR
jgi:hypothetical protein